MYMTKLIVEAIDHKYVRLVETSTFESKVLNKSGFSPTVTVPVGFVFDYESVPRIPIIYALLGHTSKRGGVGHDYLYRKDSIPTVPKPIADKVYVEIMTARGNPWIIRKLKYWGVKIGGGSSYHKLKVDAMYEEVCRA